MHDRIMLRISARSLKALSVSLIICILVSAGPAFSKTNTLDEPVNWPWRAVTVEEMAENPGRLSLLKKELGINAVLLYLQPRPIAVKKNISAEDAFVQSLAWADRMLDECKKLKIVAVINLNNFPLDPQKKYNQIDSQFWNSKQDLDDVVLTVDKLVGHFLSRGDELAGYQFISEPLVILGSKNITPEQWPELLRRNIESIRRHDKERWILIDTGPGGLVSGYKKLNKIDDAKIIYDGHMYSPHPFTHQGVEGRPLGSKYPALIQGHFADKKYFRRVLKPLRDFQLQHKVPVLIGEFSAVRWAPGAEQYLQDLADIFNEYGWAWSYHSGSGWHGWDPDYNQNYPGKDTDEKKWKNDYMGLSSIRWETLKKIFKRQ